MEPYVIKLQQLGMNDVETVGGKNASLGEMISNLGSLGVDCAGRLRNDGGCVPGISVRLTALTNAFTVY